MLRLDDGAFRELGPPRAADFREGEAIIVAWQAEHAPLGAKEMLGRHRR